MISESVKSRGLAALDEFKEKYPDYKIAVATISGSHSFGWASERSDIDIRGAYIVPTEEFTNVNTPPGTIEFKAGPDCNAEFQMHEIEKFTSLLIQPNLNMMDALFVHGNLIIEKDDKVYETLCELGNKALSKQAFPHIQGMVVHMAKHKMEGFGPDGIAHVYAPKKKLYLWRELLRGIVLFEKGKLVNNLDDLVKEIDFFGTTEIGGIIDYFYNLKSKGEFIPQKDLESIEVVERALMARMLTAKEFGVLRERPQDDIRKVAKSFISQVRKDNMFAKESSKGV